MTNFQKTIINLTAIRNNLERVIRCIYSVDDSSRLSNRPERIEDSLLCFILQNYLQILLCSFLEEWGKFSGFAKNDVKVMGTLQIVSPATKQFKKWSGLRKIRSCLLAHSPRDKSGEIVFPWIILNKEKSPTTLEETILLTFCVFLIVDNINERYESEKEIAVKEILAMDRKVTTQGIPDTAELEKQFANIQSQVAKNKQEELRR